MCSSRTKDLVNNGKMGTSLTFCGNHSRNLNNNLEIGYAAAIGYKMSDIEAKSYK